METIPATATAAVITLDRSSSAPLFRQIERSLTSAIVGGLLKPGTRLPSTRALADTLEVARNTVVLAFEELLTQGFLEARVGAGTFVAAGSTSFSPARVPEQTVGESPGLSRRGTRLSGLAVTRVRQFGPPGPFRAGVPAIDVFGLETWTQGAAKAQRFTSAYTLGYGDPGGYRPLRQAIAEFLGATRAVRCSAEQVVIVSGSQQGLDLSARLLADPGDRVWVEDPARSGATGAFAAADLDTVPVSVDEDGLEVEAGIERAPEARLAYASPSHQFPLGVTMSMGRRHALVDWARSANAWILEDDYDSEFRFEGSPSPSVQGLAPERVVYVGSFSRALFPALRLGYVVVPEDAVDSFETARSLMDRQSPMWEQATLAKFISDGEFDRHLRRMRNVYLGRREALFHHAERLLDGVLTLRRNAAGLHVVGVLPPGADDLAAEEAAARRGIDVTAVSRFAMESPRPPSLLLGYGVVPENEMEVAVATLAEAVREVL